MSNFKNAKGTGVDQFAQAWISLHQFAQVVPNSEINMPLDIPKHETVKNPGVSISGFREFLFRDFCMVSKNFNITKSRMPKYQNHDLI
jgi:hypothetical protein